MLVPTGEGAVHYGAVEKFFGSAKATSCNLFVLDFTRPTRTALDSQYPLIKAFLAKAGFLSQFVNFSKCPHDNIRDEREGRKSNMILQAVSRQILQKAGVGTLLRHNTGRSPRFLVVVCLITNLTLNFFLILYFIFIIAGTHLVV